MSTEQKKEVELGSLYIQHLLKQGKKVFSYVPNHPIAPSGRQLSEDEREYAKKSIWQISVERDADNER